MGTSDNSTFRTLKGYELIENNRITHAMEDYLEMICRCSNEQGYVRIKQLAAQLHVKPSSSSKMAANLKALGLVEYEKYGIIKPTPEGLALGQYLLHRHQVIHRLFCLINHSVNELEQTEKVEHFISHETLDNIEKFISFAEDAAYGS